MTVVRKAALFCDGCGKRQDLRWEDADTLLSPIATRGTYLDGWRAVGGVVNSSNYWAVGICKYTVG